MRFSDSHEDMSPQEQHGILLRMAADRLEDGTYDLAFDAIVAVLEAEDLLAAIHKAAGR